MISQVGSQHGNLHPDETSTPDVIVCEQIYNIPVFVIKIMAILVANSSLVNFIEFRAQYSFSTKDKLDLTLMDLFLQI